jgi:hypothetical protein
VAGAEALILLPLFGMALLAFQISTAMEPPAFAASAMFVIVQENGTGQLGIPTLPVPVPIGFPAIGIVIVWVTPLLALLPSGPHELPLL